MKKAQLLFLINLLLIAFLLQLSPALFAQTDSTSEKKLKFFADTRIRLEHDWNVRKADHELKDVRTRMRFRFRFGFDYKWSNEIQFGARMRSGVPEDQQSPHWTLGKEFEVYSFKIDRVYIKGDHDKFWWWVGKNNLPFWKQNELFWDDDVLPEGVSIGSNLTLGENLIVKPIGGIFISKSAGDFFHDDGIFYAGQLTAIHKNNLNKIVLSSGIFNFVNLLDLNQLPAEKKLDYSILLSSVQYQRDFKYPLSFGVDFMYNFSNYEDESWIMDSKLEEDRIAYVLSLSCGSLINKGDIQLGYRYAHIEKYAVVDYFAQDDWVSWSFPENTPGTRSSNLQGHEFQAAYAFGPGFNIVTRLYVAKGIKKSMPTDLSLESADRIRVDLNIGF